MNLYLNNVKMEHIVPVFFGCLCSLVVCTLLAVRQLNVVLPPEPAAPEIAVAAVDEDADMFADMSANAVANAAADAAVSPVREYKAVDVYKEVVKDVFFQPETVCVFTGPDTGRPDIIQELYRRIETRIFVIDYFAEICPTREIAEIILIYADLFDIPPALALALAWEESRLNPRAVNSKNKNGSTDRGLFQLNNKSFPRLENHAFFSPDVNARHGMAHLRHCLDTGGSEIAALAMYNAGTGRVSSTGTPKSTLDYVSRILENRLKIENRFSERGIYYQKQEENIPETVAEAKHFHPRLFPLKPLAGAQ